LLDRHALDLDARERLGVLGLERIDQLADAAIADRVLVGRGLGSGDHQRATQAVIVLLTARPRRRGVGERLVAGLRDRVGEAVDVDLRAGWPGSATRPTCRSPR